MDPWRKSGIFGPACSQIEIPLKHILFSLQEMWEVAFHGLARLEQRSAYLMVKGAMEHPELIRTQENPVAPHREFPFDEKYFSLEVLTAAMKTQKQTLLARIENFLQEASGKKRSAGNSAAKETGLGFVDEN